MAFCAAVGTDSIKLMSEAQAAAMANGFVTPWVRIAADGTVTILTAGAEMGPGSMTPWPRTLPRERDAAGPRAGGVTGPGPLRAPG